MTDGISKLRATSEKLKAETEEKELQTKKAVESQLAQIRANSELSKMYEDSSQVGTENLGSETPQLKVHATGRSNNELADGTEPTDGQFFYKPTAEAYDTIDCHILTISRGFKAPSFEDEKREVFNQIMGGVIIDNGEYKPFIMYFTGLKLSNLWEFGKSVRKYTRMKIPMFALTVRLSTEKKANNYGKSWVINFDVVKESDGTPRLILDPGVFQFLKDNVQTTEELISSLIQAKEVVKEDREEVVPIRAVEGEQDNDFASGAVDEPPVNPDEIPF